MNETLQVELLSDATFATTSINSDIDIEIAHDDLGLPFVPGTTLKRLVADSWRQMAGRFTATADAGLAPAARDLFGREGATDTSGIVDVSDATVDLDSIDWIRSGQQNHRITPQETLSLLSTVRTQTAVNPATGAPLSGSLRRRRACRRDLLFTSHLSWLTDPTPDHLRVLALGVMATRHGGVARNRGAGLLRVTLDGDLTYTRQTAGVGQ